MYCEVFCSLSDYISITSHVTGTMAGTWVMGVNDSAETGSLGLVH